MFILSLGQVVVIQSFSVTNVGAFTRFIRAVLENSRDIRFRAEGLKAVGVPDFRRSCVLKLSIVMLGVEWGGEGGR